MTRFWFWLNPAKQWGIDDAMATLSSCGRYMCLAWRVDIYG